MDSGGALRTRPTRRFCRRAAVLASATDSLLRCATWRECAAAARSPALSSVLSAIVGSATKTPRESCSRPAILALAVCCGGREVSERCPAGASPEATTDTGTVSLSSRTILIKGWRRRGSVTPRGRCRSGEVGIARLTSTGEARTRKGWRQPRVSLPLRPPAPPDIAVPRLGLNILQVCTRCIDASLGCPRSTGRAVCSPGCSLTFLQLSRHRCKPSTTFSLPVLAPWSNTTLDSAQRPLS